jgi:undecaprenyl-diphosphatase
LIAGIVEKRNPTGSLAETAETNDLSTRQASLIGIVQGLCLPFRGFSRSGATISTGMLAGVAKSKAEAFSFALAVVITPAVVAREAMRLIHAERITEAPHLAAALLPSFLGAVFAFFAGLVALNWLTQWLEGGRWYLFGIYCLLAAAMAAVLHRVGY